MSSGKLVIEAVVAPPFMENTLLMSREGAPECVVVDPGFRPDQIEQRITARNLKPVMFLVTHGHIDHIAGIGELKARWPEAPIVIGAGDAPMLTDAGLNLSKWSGMSVVSPPADRKVAEGELIETAGMRFEVLDIPGHSRGHVVYLMRDESPYIVVGGDVLFQGSIGRCDFPGGNQEQLVSGIRQKLFTLPDDTIVYTGHGPSTTVGIERRSNPFCGENAGLYGLE